MPVTRLACAAVLVALLPCRTSVGQSSAPVARLRTFHIQGMIRTDDGSAVSRAEVRFEGHEFNKAVFADSRGFYEADLPLGSYAMTADALKPVDLRIDPFTTTTPQDPYQTGLQEYKRPLFRVTSPTRLTLDVTLDREGLLSCDKVTAPSGATPTSNDGETVCGGGNFFPIPSDNNVPFELFIRFRTRRTTDKGFVYNTDRDWRGWTTPVFVAYNLFTLRANSVIYDLRTGTLQATGDVVVVNADGETQRGDSMTFRIENGKATRLHSH
jgi:hypothetical protein